MERWPRWLKALVLKTRGCNSSEGSNPSLSSWSLYTMKSILERSLWECGMAWATAQTTKHRDHLHNRGITMKYRIKYEYKTGDSFHTREEKSILEYEWEDIEIAKEALSRIREHYKWYEYMESPRWRGKVPIPKWFKVSEKNEDIMHHLINLPMDNGKEVQFYAPWCGYFETLYGAEIVVSDSEYEGTSFTLH